MILKDDNKIKNKNRTTKINTIITQKIIHTQMAAQLTALAEKLKEKGPATQSELDVFKNADPADLYLVHLPKTGDPHIMQYNKVMDGLGIEIK